MRKEPTLVGSRLSRRLLPRVIEWLADGRLDPRGMVTEVFPAAHAKAAFDLIERDPDGTLKVQLDFG